MFQHFRSKKQLKYFRGVLGTGTVGPIKAPGMKEWSVGAAKWSYHSALLWAFTGV